MGNLCEIQIPVPKEGFTGAHPCLPIYLHLVCSCFCVTMTELKRRLYGSYSLKYFLLFFFTEKKNLLTLDLETLS